MKARRGCALPVMVLLLHLLVASRASAQRSEHFSAALSMTRTAVRMGECNPVTLTLEDASGKEWPRGPNGMRVSMADFDLRVTAPAARAAVGRYDGPNSFAVCACPRAPAGTVATVTATYPGKWIAAKSRVPDVSFTTTLSAPLVAGPSSGNFPGCEGLDSSTGGTWTVTVQPSMSVLPIGGCSAVYLTIRDSTGKDTPRGPSGQRVSLADFEMSTTAANGADVVGMLDGTSSFSACACQSGTVGEAATITATYPAQQLDAKLRVQGVAVKATAPVTFAAARGTSNPAGCASRQLAVKQLGDAPVALRSPPATIASTVSAPTIREAPPVLTTTPVAVASGTAKGPLATAAGVAPTGVTLNASPRIARLSWNAMPNVTRYAVWRGSGTAASIERTPSGFTATQFADTVPDAHETYRYAVIAYYAEGKQGEAPAVQFTSPSMVNPAGFTAQPSGVVGGGGIIFQWQAVPGAARYRIDGPGLPATGYFAIGTSAGHPHIPGGPGTWRLQTMYPGNIGDSANATLASTMMHALPTTRAAPWLTHRNGSGTVAQVQTPAYFPPLGCSEAALVDPVTHELVPYWNRCTNAFGDNMPPASSLTQAYSPDSARWLGENPFSKIVENPDHTSSLVSDPDGLQGLVRWLDVDMGFWTDPLQYPNEAVYGNPLDLGVGRRASCAQEMKGPPNPGLKTVCYATAHGPIAGTAGFNDPNTISHPQEGVGSDFILSMMIIKEPSGTTFLALSSAGNFTLLPTVRLDTEGPKIVPFACISCHGGTYNATTRRVDGASFLPLDPGLLSFASPADQAAQEEKIRKINRIIYDAQPGTAIAQYLNGLYHGAIGAVGTVSVRDYVPASWASQTGFYRQVVKPHCTMCHLAAPDSWNFASWQNFQDNANLIYADVCQAHTMPHAEVPFRNFWLKDTGILYLPGLLAATLGKPSC
jgi:hypothetical protein